jgi:hypothetical protein
LLGDLEGVVSAQQVVVDDAPRDANKAEASTHLLVNKTEAKCIMERQVFLEFNIVKTYLVRRTELKNKVTDDAQLKRVGSKLLGSHFLGAYSYDKVPWSRVKDKSSFIINVDHSSKKGSHWVAVHCEKGVCYLYDSFGRKSRKLLKPFLTILKKQGYRHKDSDYDQEQANKADTCGQFSLAWLYIVQTRGIECALTI